MNWKKELKPFMELMAAVLLTFVLVVGLIHNIVKPFWDYRKRGLKDRFKSILNWYRDIVMQTVYVIFYLIEKVLKTAFYIFTLRIWKGIKFLTHETARALDLLGNVWAGELIEDITTPYEKTYFGLGEITISAAMGYLEYKSFTDSKAMTKVGIWFSDMLNVAFNEDQHSLWSWEREIRDHKVYGKEGYLDTII